MEKLPIDVFICYSSADREIAKTIVAYLEASNVKCWLAYRDIKTGANWSSDLKRAISEAHLFVVIITETLNSSVQTLSEIRLANQYQKPIISFVKEITPLSDQLQFQIAGKTAIDAFGKDFTLYLPQLLENIKKLLPKNTTDETTSLKVEIQMLRKENESLKAQLADKLNPIPSQETSFAVFISKKSNDYGFAKPLIDFLRAKGLKLFVSEEDLPDLKEADYHREIEKAIENCKHMLVILSKSEYADSSWVRFEWSTFFKEKMKSSKLGNLLTIKHESVLNDNLPITLRHLEVFEMNTDNFDSIYAYIKE